MPSTWLAGTIIFFFVYKLIHSSHWTSSSCCYVFFSFFSSLRRLLLSWLLAGGLAAWHWCAFARRVSHSKRSRTNERATNQCVADNLLARSVRWKHFGVRRIRGSIFIWPWQHNAISQIHNQNHQNHQSLSLNVDSIDSRPPSHTRRTSRPSGGYFAMVRANANANGSVVVCNVDALKCSNKMTDYNQQTSRFVRVKSHTK